MFPFGPFTFDPATGALRRDGELIELPLRTQEVLGALLAQPGKLVTYTDLRIAVWSGREIPDGYIDLYVTVLRDVLGSDRATHWIAGDRRGFRFLGPGAQGAPAPTPTPFVIPTLPPVAPEAPAKAHTPAPKLVPEPAPEPRPEPAPEPEPEPEIVVPPPTVAPEPAPEATPLSEPIPRPAAARSLTFVAIAFAAIVVASLGYLGWQRFDSGARTLAPAAPAGLAPIRSILVVPFRVTPQDAAHGYLSAAIADSLQLRLNAALQAHVAQAVAPTRGADPADLGKRYGADVVITGSLEAEGTTLRLSIEMVRVADRQVESTLTRVAEAGQIFSLQNQAAAHVARVVEPGLSKDAMARLTRQDSSTAEAYALLSQARDAWRRRTRDAVNTAIERYRAAVRSDPDSVPAHAELAAAYATLDHRSDPLVALPRAKAAAERAVAIDAGSARAQAALGVVRYRFEWRWADAEAAFIRAIALAPRDAFTRHQYGVFLHVTGRTEPALVELARALALEPDSPVILADTVAPLLRAGRTAAARATLDALSAIEPGWPSLDQVQADVLAAEGHADLSVASLWRALAARGLPRARVDELRAAYRTGGVATMLERRAVQLQREGERGPSPTSYVLATELALTHAALKHRDQTLHWLAVAIDLREEAPLHMRASAVFDFLRSDPGFAELLRRARIDGQ